MSDTSYIKMSAAEVGRLCNAKMVEYEKTVAWRTEHYAKKWRKTWRARIALFFTRKPLNDFEACEKWLNDSWDALYPYHWGEVNDLLEASKAGGEMLVSVEDYNMIQGA